jgi:hypothetical protein
MPSVRFPQQFKNSGSIKFAGKDNMQKIVLLLIVLVAMSAVSAQDVSTWKVVNAEPIHTLTDDQPQNAVLAPDSSAIAWGDSQELCLYRFAEEETKCYALPENFTAFGRYSFLNWSPDSAYLAFNDSFFDYYYEPDIWVFEVATETFTNRTDDGITDGVLSALEEGAIFDYIPVWNPVNGDMYFFRSTEVAGIDRLSLELYLMPLSRTEPKLVRDLTRDFPIYSIYRQPVISPDGTKMALIVIPARHDDPHLGVWVLNLQNGDLDQVATLDDLQQGLPDWLPEDALLPPDTLTWAGNDGLVVLAANTVTRAPLAQNAYYIDLVAATVQPLLDFSALPDEEAFLAEDENGDTPLLRMPRTGTVTPDGSTWVYVGSNPGVAIIYALPLPPDGSPPTEIDRIEPLEVGPWSRSVSSINADGTALLWGYMMELSGSRLRPRL